MARLIQTECAEVFPIIIYRGITLSIPWTYYQSDGETPVDLGGSTWVFKLKFGETILTYTETPNSFGSLTEITDEAGGEFRILITDEETAQMELTEEVGRWWLEQHIAGDVFLRWADDVTVVDV